MNSTLLINLSSVIDQVSHTWDGHKFSISDMTRFTFLRRDNKFIEAIELTIENTWRSL